MADEKSKKAKTDPDSKKTGGSCGFSLGCLVIVAAVAAVVFFLFIKPALEEAGYSYDDFKEKFIDIKDKANDALDKGSEVYEDSKEKYEDVKEQTSEVFDKGEEVYQDSKEKLEDVKDTTDEQIDDFSALDGNAREELNKAAPKLIAD